jgi:type II secretion system protein C
MEKLKNFLRKLNVFKKSSDDMTDYSYEDESDFTHEDSQFGVEIPNELKKKDNKLKSFGKKFTASLKSKMAKASSDSAASSSSINFNKIFQTVFSPESRPFIHKAFIVLFFSGTTFFVGRLVALMIKPDTSVKKKVTRSFQPSNTGELQGHLTSIRNNDLFNAKGDTKAPVKVEKKIDKNLVCKKASRRSSLPINLVSTVVLQDSVKSVASVQVRGNKGLQYLREGEKVNNIAEIGAIVEKKVILKNLNSGECEYVAAKEKREKRLAPIKVERNLQKGKKIIQAAKRTGISNEGNKFKIKKSLRDEMLSDMTNILTQARAVQIQNPDGTLSFSMQEIVPGSIFSNLNIQDGDIINNINGKSINSLNEIMSQFGQLKTRDHYEITLKRNGEEITYEYDFID